MRILLTGSSGFIGNNFLNKIAKYKHEVLAIYNKKKPKLEIKNPKISFLKFDLKKKTPKKIIEFNPDIIFHFAWQGIPNFSFSNSEINFKNSFSFLKDLIDNTEVKKIIVSGSCFEYYDQKSKDKFIKYKFFIHAKRNLYSKLKQICFEKKITLGWFRIFFVYGKGQRENSLIPYIIKSFKSKKIPKILNLEAKNDFIHIDDVCNLFLSTLKKNFKSGLYDLGSGKLTSVDKIIKIIIKKMNLNYLSIQSKNNKDKIKTKKNIKANIKKISKSFNWSIKLNLDEGVNKVISNFKSS